jgi:hypothetical protein
MTNPPHAGPAGPGLLPLASVGGTARRTRAGT